MKKILILCFIFNILISVSYAQTSGVILPNASIEFVIKNSPKQTLKLLKRNLDAKYDFLDSAILGNKGALDTLHFDLHVDPLREAHFALSFSVKKIGLFVPLLIPGDHLKVTADFDKPDNITFTGSKHTQEFYNYGNKHIGGNYPDGEFAKYKDALQAHSPDSLMLKRKIDSINRLRSAWIRNAIFTTNSAYLEEVALMGAQNGMVTLTHEEFDELREKFKNEKICLMQLDLNENLQDHPYVEKPKPAIDTYLADFTLPDAKGRPVSLSQFKGKYVLVDFWASWCSPCRQQIPNLKEALKLYGKNNFIIIAVSIDENTQNWQAAITKDGTQPFIHLIDVRAKTSPILAQFNIQTIPANFLLDPTGKILETDLRDKKIVGRIAEITSHAYIRK